MSYEASTWAVKIIEQHPEWKTPLRFVLLIMANRADEEGYLYPSVRWIMARTALAESTVRAATQELQRLRLLVKIPRHRDNGGGQTSNEYQLAMNQFLLKLDTPGPLDGGAPVHGGPQPVHGMEGRGPDDGPQEKKENKKQKKKDAPMPDGFVASPSVVEWARKNNFEPYLPIHLEYLIDWAKQNPGDWTADWDARLRNSIRADWGGVRKQAQAAERRGERPSTLEKGIWWATEKGIREHGESLGVKLEPGELFTRYTARVFIAAGDGAWIGKASVLVRMAMDDLRREAERV